MANDWLFPDKRPFWDDSRPDMSYADCNSSGLTHEKADSEQNVPTETPKSAESAVGCAERAIQKPKFALVPPAFKMYTQASQMFMAV